RWIEISNEKHLFVVSPIFDLENYMNGPMGGYRGLLGRHRQGIEFCETDADGFVNNILDEWFIKYPTTLTNTIYIFGHSAPRQAGASALLKPRHDKLVYW
ncbi:MAG: hypothetical protein GY845_25350, partial [Planctomycetes bacterium]|nr:hypothetical protein [Planctomycetota bacterium]